jgi:hypothetical protein
MFARLSGIQNEIDPQTVEDPVLASLKTYWNEKRGGRAMPARADINPAELKENLGWIILVDAFPGFVDFRFRIIGTRVAKYFIAESTGKTVSEVFGPYGEGAVKGVQAVYRRAARDKVIVRSYGGAGWLGQSFLDFDALAMPLSDDGETANMVLSVFTFDFTRLSLSRGSASLG